MRQSSVRPLFYSKKKLTEAVLLVCGASTLSTFAVAQNNDVRLEEIIVTAERVERDLQSTPISVVSMSGQALLELGVETAADISNFIPNVSIGASAGQSGSNEPQFTIRGVSQLRTGISGDRSVGFYVDEQFFPRTTGSLMRALDVQNVEVLRGPQGTLFGRNNTGGAIKFTNMRPTDELEGSLRLGLGDYDRRDVTGIINVPITDSIAFRGSASSLNRDGYVEGQNGQTKGNVDDTSWRGSLRFDITDNLSANISYTGVRAEDAGFPMISTGDINPYDLDIIACQVANPTECPGGTHFVSFPGTGSWVGVPVGPNPGFTRGMAVTDDMYTYVGGDQEFVKTDTDVLNFQVSYDINDTWRVRSITGGMKIDVDQFRDGDQSPLPLIRNFGTQEHESWSQEFHLVANGLFDGRFNLLSGVFFFGEENGDTSRTESYGGLGGAEPWSLLQGTATGVGFPGSTAAGHPWINVAPPIFPGFPPTVTGVCPRYFPFNGDPTANPIALTPQPGSQELMGCLNTANVGFREGNLIERSSTGDSWAIFADGTYAVTDKLSVSAGARYSEDKKSWEILGSTTTILQQELGSKGDTWSATDWRMVVQYDWSDDLMTYLNVSKAYKSGGFTDNIPFGFGGFPGFGEGNELGVDTRHPITCEVIDSPFIPYGPEEVIAYELGLRSEWYDNRVRANLTLFQMDYTDKHTQLLILPGFGGGNTDCAGEFGGGNIIVNAAEVQIRGVETELMFAVTRDLTLSAMGGYLDGKYKKIDPLAGSVTLNTPLQRTPEWSYTLSARYDMEIGRGNAFAQITYAFTDDQMSGDDENVQWPIQPLKLTNARLQYSSGDMRWSAGLFVNNLFDERYDLGGVALSSFAGGVASFNTAAVGADLIMPGAPRQWGVDFTYNFGGGR